MIKKKPTKNIEEQKAIPSLKNPTEWIYQFWAWIIIAWCLYRYAFHFSEPIDEFVVKPLIFVLPVLWYVRIKEGRELESVGLTLKTHGKSLLISIGFGLVFLGEAIAVNIVKYGHLQVASGGALSSYGLPLLLLLSLATAFSEELLARGFLFTRMYEVTKKLWTSAIITSLLFLSFHVPILLTTYRYTGMTLILYFLTKLALGIANCFVLSKTKSLIAPILIHVFWNVIVAVLL